MQPPKPEGRGRKKRAHAAENHERWLVSYADFITLLFAFFVVMFATAQADKSKARAVSEAIQNALKNGTMSPAIQAMLKPREKEHPASSPKETPTQSAAAPARTEDEELTKSLEVLASSLREEVKRGSIHLDLQRRGLVVELKAGALFPSGEATIEEAAYPTVKKVAAVLNTLPNPLRLEGHTDSLPINTSRFQSNWELSAARSIAMLRCLNEQFGVARVRMAIVGYADTEAVGSNETEEGRERNRRVDIVIVSSYGMRAEPAPVSKSGGTKPAELPKTDSKEKF